jgi:hypothetical protein
MRETQMQQERQCQTCRFWLISRLRSTGECRRRAPQVVAHVNARDMQSIFPTTAGTDWCGEWEGCSAEGTYPEEKELVALS